MAAPSLSSEGIIYSPIFLKPCFCFAIVLSQQSVCMLFCAALQPRAPNGMHMRQSDSEKPLYANELPRFQGSWCRLL